MITSPHETRKLTIVLPADVIESLRSKLRSDETVSGYIKTLIRKAASSHD